jgi:hypothetical protein
MTEKYYRILNIETKDGQMVPSLLYCIYNSSKVIKAMIDDIGIEGPIWLNMDADVLKAILIELDKYNTAPKANDYTMEFLYRIFEADHEYEFGLIEKLGPMIIGDRPMDKSIYNILTKFSLWNFDELSGCWKMILLAHGPFDYFDNAICDKLYANFTGSCLCRALKALKRDIDANLDTLAMLFNTMPGFANELARWSRLYNHKYLGRIMKILIVKYGDNEGVIYFCRCREFYNLDNDDKNKYRPIIKK